MKKRCGIPNPRLSYYCECTKCGAWAEYERCGNAACGGETEIKYSLILHDGREKDTTKERWLKIRDYLLQRYDSTKIGQQP